MDPVAAASPRTRVLAHRGWHDGGIAANSLGAFEAAANLGVDLLELDVRRTRDGVLVIHHDAALADGRKLAELDAAQLPPLADGQPIATLEQVGDLARRRGIRVAVELKEEGYERAAVATLLARVPREQVEIISFSRDSIRAVEALDPAIRTGLLEPRIPEWLRASAFYPAARWLMDTLDWHPSLSAAARVGADYVSVEHRMATPKFLAAAHHRGVKVDAWTVNDPARISQLLVDGVDGIVTDRPDVALALASA